MNRIIVMVMDSLGCGEAPDANSYGDEGSDTLGHIYQYGSLKLPNLKRLGLYNIDGLSITEKEEYPIGAYGKAQEQSAGKNSPVGHWEMSGYIKEEPFAVYPNGFPEKMLEEWMEKTGVKGILCNKKGSGTEFLKQYGEEHLKTGYPIIYTSADSVFQIAAHEEIIPVEKLYQMCEMARKLFSDPKYNVGTIIARPFVGSKPEDFQRTYHRKDYELDTFGKTMLDVIKESGKEVIAIGKIEDLFSGRGITEAIHTEGNADGIERTLEAIRKDQQGIIFTNLVDFDMMYGHRNNLDGYARALEYLDGKLPEIMSALKEEDVLLLTADHGNDPYTPSTDHSREYVPILVYGKQIKENINIGIRKTYADISATVLEMLGLNPLENGQSFRKEII